MNRLAYFADTYLLVDRHFQGRPGWDGQGDRRGWHWSGNSCSLRRSWRGRPLFQNLPPNTSGAKSCKNERAKNLPHTDSLVPEHVRSDIMIFFTG